MPGRAPRRLPGVRFAAAPPPVDPLPRMDIALFAGFAAEGPLHVPVAVESAAEYAAIFGQDAVVAWDAVRGEAVYAHLGPAVRAFFRNGGRRAWIVRAAGSTAACDLFPVTGLLRASREGFLSPAVASARAVGSWADDLQVSAALLAARIVEAKIVEHSPPLLALGTDAGSELSPGDLLRITFREQGYVWMVPVSAIALADGTGGASPRPPGHGRVFKVMAQGSGSFWFRTGKAGEELTGQFSAYAFESGEPSTAPPRPPMSATFGDAPFRDDEITFTLDPPFHGALVEGALLRIDLGAEELWVRIRKRDIADPRTGQITVQGSALRRMKAPPSPAELAALPREPTAERLRLELWTRAGEAPPQRLSDLAFGPAHPRFWGALPTDEEVYRARLQADEDVDRGNAGSAKRLDLERWSALWQSAESPRFPLAGDGRWKTDEHAAEDFYLPLGMSFTADVFLGAAPPSLSAPARDGLVDLDGKAALDQIFLDPDLAETHLEILASQADFLRYQSPAPRALTGIHAALGIEEVTLLALPDAAHRRWSVPRAPKVEQDTRAAEAPSIPAREEGVFGDCRLPLEAPRFDEPVFGSSGGSFTLRWTGALDAGSGHVPGERYRLEESPSEGFDPSEAIYDRSETHVDIHGRSPGTWYYRVRIENAAGPGPWSKRLAVPIRAVLPALLEDEAAYEGGGALALTRMHAAMLRLCAARGDILALLDLPEHHREQQAMAHAAGLTFALGPGDEAALGFGALYHPWLFTLEEALPGASFRRAPPSGAVAGMMAQRALSRGAWVAAANVPLRAVVALSPILGREAWQALDDAQINLVRQEPAGFLTLAEDTLSADAELVPIHVRRLLSLLRRAALKLGATYVFEPNGDALHRMVQRGFEALLGRMYARGAFAGQNQRAAFQVVAEGPGSAREAEEGRFTVDLRVAPAAALSFLTVRLVQSGDRSQITEVR